MTTLGEISTLVLSGFASIAAVYVGAYYLSQVAMLVAAWLEIRRQKRGRHVWHPTQVLESRELPRISIVVPAYNEAIPIVRTVRSLLDSGYPDFEVVVVNDGSKDDTLGVLAEAFDLEPVTDRVETALASQPVRQLLRGSEERNLRVVDKRNGGKADALNCGINYATGGLICAIDADVLLDRWALFHLVRPFLDDPDTVASSGMIRLHNGCRLEDGRVAETRLARSWIEGLQVLEYVRAFAVGRMFFNRLDGHVIISGAFGLFRREVLLALGGYQPFSIGEDMELVVRIHRHLRSQGQRYRIRFVCDAICYTEAPTSIGELGGQRTRWHQGLLTTLRVHRRMLFRRRYGRIGWLVLPYFLLFELLAPIVELAGWALLPASWLLGLVTAPRLGLFLVAAVVLGTAASWLAIAIDVSELGFFTRAGDRLRLFFLAVIESFGYHQLTLYFRWRAFPRFYRSIHLRGGWRPPQRAELAKEAGPSVK